MLQGNQIILRPVSPADLELMDQMNQDAETMRFIGGTGTPRGRIEQFIQEQQAQFAQQGWGWMTIETPQEKVGFAFLRQCPRLAEIELGYRLHRHFWEFELSRPLLDHNLPHLIPCLGAIGL